MKRKISKSRTIRGLAAAMALAVVPNVSNANTVFAGLDLIATLPGTFFDFAILTGGILGVVEFEGVPINPALYGNADTIAHRLEDAFEPVDTIDVEMIELSLISVDPVNLGGATYEVEVNLDQTEINIGSMTIHHTELDNFTDEAEGYFTSTIDLHLIVDFVGLSSGAPALASVLFETTIQGGGCWTHELTGKPEYVGPPFPGETNFFLASTCPQFEEGLKYEHLFHEGEHLGTAACFGGFPCPPNEVPAPAPLPLMLMGLTGLLASRALRQGANAHSKTTPIA